MDPANAEQFVKFGPGAWNRGTICHEVGHALGLWHEQQRPDRDTYIVINWNHMDPWQQPNFAIISGGGTQGTGYDFYSVMHYRRDALSNNGQDTIGMQPAYAQYLDVIGTVYDRTLSKGDRAGIATIYGNPEELPSAVVTNTNDGGPGSLRTAIYFAFDKSTAMPPVPTTITFQIPTSDPNYSSGTGVFTIKPTSILTALGSGTTIDGASQAAFTGNTNPNGPELVLDGSIITSLQGPLGIYAPGLTLRASGCTVKGLTITNFNQSGIVLFQGTDPNGSATTGNVIQGNSIGTDQGGAVAQPNGYSGIVSNLGAHGNTIGGGAVGASNIIAGNTYEGIALYDATTINNTIRQNSIFANHFAGIALNGGSNNNQPAPALSSAVLGPAGNVSGVDVGGTLTGSAANTNFRIEFFASPPGTDEGQFFVGSAGVLTDESGTATFSSPPTHLAAAVPKNHVITATATDPGGSTSRCSSPLSVSSTDTDSDGMPDAWEGLHLFNPGSSADAGIDSDVDGFTNLQEFQDGTDPRIGFQALAGKTYRLKYRDDLVAGSWRPLVNGIFSPVTATVQLVDAEARGVTKRHYLVTVEP